MSIKNKLKGAALAGAAAALFTAAPVTAMAGSNGNVKCVGVNACKGLSSCKTAASSCKAQNSCKGQGFVLMSKHACEQIGGKVGN
ncbi:MAG: hypothetical protein P8Y64_01980 [Gammaproteobacteria bacterium]|jgi:uncharacterized membrane protein